MLVFHLTAPDVWAAARASGSVHPPSLEDEGFVHCSFRDQVTGSARRHYADAPALVALAIDIRDESAQLRIEDSYGSGTDFPHVYGEIPVSAVVEVHELRRDRDGRWSFELSADDAGAAASPDR